MHDPIYLDYNATTPVDRRVVEAMLPYLTDRFGNPSSAHAYGYAAQEAMQRARRQVAGLIGAQPAEVVFTGGGSEADNQAIKGVLLARLDHRPHVITCSTEHPAVLNALSYLSQRFGVEVSVLPVDRHGIVSPRSVQNKIRPETALVTLMHANNEVGSIQQIEAISEITRAAGVLFHVDAAQSAGKIPIDVSAAGIDLLTIAGHKVYAPKGVGALYVRHGTVLDPLIHGSGQENGRRAGTENIAGMVALGAAAEIAAAELDVTGERVRSLRDDLHRRLEEAIPGLLLNGHPLDRLPNTLNVSFPGILNQALLAAAGEVAASTGAACHAGLTEPSAVLIAMGLGRERALGSVRLTLGRWTTEADVARAAAALTRAYREVLPTARVPV